MIPISALPPLTRPQALHHQKEGTFSQSSLCPSQSFWNPLASDAQLTDCLNSIPASHPCFTSILAIPDPLKSAVAKTFHNPRKRSPGCSCTDHPPAGPEDNPYAVHSGVMWARTFILLPGPQPASSFWILRGAGLWRWVLEDPSGTSKQLPLGP